MTKARFLPKADYDRLKSASRDAVQLAGGLKRVIEFITRGSMGRLSEAISPDCDDRFPAIDQVADIEAQIGKPIITAVLADMLGCDLTPRETKPSTETLQALTGRMAKEFGEAADKCLHDENSAEDTIRELRDLAEVVNTLIATLTSRHTLRSVA